MTPVIAVYEYIYRIIYKSFILAIGTDLCILQDVSDQEDDNGDGDGSGGDNVCLAGRQVRSIHITHSMRCF